jgi:alpha-tubulin suppressor-like RCC1 family protein
MRTITIALVCGAALSCSSCTSTTGVRVAAHFAIAAGDQQSAVVGTQLTNPLVIKVTDAQGNPVAGQTVNFVVTSGGGSVFGGAETTNGNGNAQELWTLGKSTADSQRVEARAVDPTTGQPLTFGVFKATALAAAPQSLGIYAGNNQQQIAAVALPDSIAVLVVDKYKNPVPAISVTWHPYAGSGAVMPSTTTTNTAGVAATHWAVGPRLGVDSVTASASGLAPALFGAKTIIDPPASITKLSGDGQTGIAGLLVPIAPTVQLTDVNGHPASNAWVYYDAGGVGWIVGEKSGQDSTLSDMNGVATLRGWLLAPGKDPLNAGIIFVNGQTSTPMSVTFNATGVAQLQVTSVAAIDSTSCATTNVGAVLCWGDAAHGELGTNATGVTESIEPVPIQIGQSLHAIAGGGESACGLTATGAAYCWGANVGGMLGRGAGTLNVVNDPNAQPVVGNLTFVSLAMSDSLACGLGVGGTAYCWGLSTDGGLGDGLTHSPGFQGQPTPTAVVGGLTFTALSVGGDNACGISGGAVYCWGNNQYGQLGNTTMSSANTPQQVPSTFQAIAIAVGNRHVCALASGGAAYCWGLDSFGELGRGDTTSAPVPTPTPVVGGLSFTEISAGAQSTCGLASGGLAYCWGRNGYYAGLGEFGLPQWYPFGTLGTGQTDGAPDPAPTAVAGGYTFSSISTASGTSCGLRTDGVPMCWGVNQFGSADEGEGDAQGPTPVVAPFVVTIVPPPSPYTARVRQAPRPTLRRAVTRVTGHTH